MAKKREGLVGGLILIGIGLLALVGQFVNFGSWNPGLLLLPALGAIFLLWGILARDAGPIIPGGILSGIGWAIMLIAGPFQLMSGADDGGIFMLVFGLGFASITLLTAIFTAETHWWALIPGGIMGLVGLTVLYGGIFGQTLEAVGKFWPVALIALGVYIIFTANRNKAVKKQ